MTREEMLDEAVRRVYCLDKYPNNRFVMAVNLSCMDETWAVIKDIRAEFRRQYEMNVCEACGSTDKYPEHLCPAKPRAKPWQPSYRR